MWKAYEINGLILYTDEEIQVKDEKTGMPIIQTVKVPVTISQEELKKSKQISKQI